MVYLYFQKFQFRSVFVMMKKILCVGEILWDMMPTGAKEGGAPMNVAIHLKKLGYQPEFLSRIGNDSLGDSLRDFLLKNGIPLKNLQVDPILATSTVEVTINQDNSVYFDIVDNVAWDNMEITDDIIETAKLSEAIVFGSLASRHFRSRETIVTLVKNCPGTKIMDVNLRPPYVDRIVIERLLSLSDMVKLNNDELNVISGWNGFEDGEREQIKRFSEKYGSDLVCVTRGENGAIVYRSCDNTFVEHSGYRVRVKDTVGAGDAFLAGFLSCFLGGEKLDYSLEFANATGALVASKTGASPQYDVEEILSLIKKGS